METPRIFFIVSFAPIALLAIILSTLYKCADAETVFHDTIINEQYNAVIKARYKDDKNRLARTLQLANQHGHNTTFIADSWLGLWDNAEVGDHIMKNAGDSILVLVKKNPDTTFYLTYNFKRAGRTLLRRK